MLSCFAATENEKKNQNDRIAIARKLSNKYSGKFLFAISVVENESRAVLSGIGDRAIARANRNRTEPE